MLAAVARDLRHGFGEDYRILRAASGPEALDLLRQLRARGDQVALLIADQRMPGMPGTDYASSSPTPSACCSPRTPTPRRRSPRSTTSRSTIVGGGPAGLAAGSLTLESRPRRTAFTVSLPLSQT